MIQHVLEEMMMYSFLKAEFSCFDRCRKQNKQFSVSRIYPEPGGSLPTHVDLLLGLEILSQQKSNETARVVTMIINWSILGGSNMIK